MNVINQIGFITVVRIECFIWFFFFFLFVFFLTWPLMANPIRRLIVFAAIRKCPFKWICCRRIFNFILYLLSHTKSDFGYRKKNNSECYVWPTFGPNMRDSEKIQFLNYGNHRNDLTWDYQTCQFLNDSLNVTFPIFDPFRSQRYYHNSNVVLLKKGYVICLTFLSVVKLFSKTNNLYPQFMLKITHSVWYVTMFERTTSLVVFELPCSRLYGQMNYPNSLIESMLKWLHTFSWIRVVYYNNQYNYLHFWGQTQCETHESVPIEVKTNIGICTGPSDSITGMRNGIRLIWRFDHELNLNKTLLALFGVLCVRKKCGIEAHNAHQSNRIPHKVLNRPTKPIS